MSAPNDGGPAFPSRGIYSATDSRSEQRDGMTLRDWFAGQALAGWLASYGDAEHPAATEPLAANVVQYSYDMADAMLAERARGGDK